MDYAGCPARQGSKERLTCSRVRVGGCRWRCAAALLRRFEGFDGRGARGEDARSHLVAADEVSVVEFNDEKVGFLDGTASPCAIPAHKKIGGDHFPSINENPLLIQHEIRFPEFQQYLFLGCCVLDHKGCLLVVARDPSMISVFRSGDNHASRGKQHEDKGKDYFHGMILRRLCLARVP